MDHLEEELTCSVCFNIYEDPRILQCSHTFCKNCLNNIIWSSQSYLWSPSIRNKQIKCPSCRGVTELHTEVHSLPINYVLKAIVEKYKRNNCHNISIKTCLEHRQPLNMYCLQDRKLICAQCLTVGKHHGHPVEDPENAYTKKCEMASKLLATLSDKSFTGVSSVISALEEQMASCKDIVQEDKKEVLKVFDRLAGVLEQKKQHFLAALNDLNQQIVEVYAPQIEAMKQIQDEELDLISLSSSAQEEEAPLVYLENIHNIQQRMIAVKQKPLLPVQPVKIYPRVGQILNDNLSKTYIDKVHLLRIPKFGIHFLKDKKIISIPWICSLITVLLFMALLSLFVLSNVEQLPSFMAMYCTCLSETIQPILNYFGIYTVQNPFQRFAGLYSDFIYYISSL